MNRRRVVLAAGILAAVAAGAVVVMADDTTLPAPANPPEPPPPPPPPSPPPPPPRASLAAAVAAGHGWRLELGGGPVQVWVPAGYHPDGAATIVYLHGFYTDLDKAWAKHRLPEQFALAAVNAVFIAAETPSGSSRRIQFPSLGDLLVDVFGATGLARPMGPVVAIGHSGAYRTLMAWMNDPGLDWLISMDAMYGDVDVWHDWLDAAPSHRMIMVGDDTARWTEELARTLGDDVVTLDRFPELDSDIPPEVADARVTYVRSQFGHMPLVTAGTALPRVMRLLPLELLADGPWQAPLVLPPPVDAGTASGSPGR